MTRKKLFLFYDITFSLALNGGHVISGVNAFPPRGLGKKVIQRARRDIPFRFGLTLKSLGQRDANDD